MQFVYSFGQSTDYMGNMVVTLTRPDCRLAACSSCGSSGKSHSPTSSRMDFHKYHFMVQMQAYIPVRSRHARSWPLISLELPLAIQEAFRILSVVMTIYTDESISLNDSRCVTLTSDILRPQPSGRPDCCTPYPI